MNELVNLKMTTAPESKFRPPIETPTDVAAIWQAAVEDYESITGIQLQTFTAVKHIDGILVQVGLNETNFKVHRNGGSKLDKFRTLVQRSLGPIEMVGHVVAHATKAAFPPSEALFSAITYLIKTANTVSSDYDKIVEFFDDLDSYLHRLKTLEHDTPKIPALEAALTEVFRSVLVLCGICTKYTQRKRIVKAFRNLVSGEDAELKSAYERFHKTVEREQAVVRYAILSDVQDLKVKTGSVHADVRASLAFAERLDNNLETVAAGVRHIQTHVEDRETALERKELLMWLSDLEFHDKQRDAFAKHHQSTGQWLLGSGPFQRWLCGEQTTALWCPGIPGAGKTVMISAAINYVEEMTEGSNVAIAYVYCDYQDSTTQSEDGILRSLTRQLVEQCTPVPPEVMEFRDKYSGRRAQPTFAERISLVKLLTQDFGRTYIFIDALDECPEENRERILDLTTELQHFVRLFITSRPNVDLQGRLSNLTRVDIVANKHDVKTYLLSEIETNKRMRLFTTKDPNLKMDIVHGLQVKAQGMFLLAHLQMRHLCSHSSVKGVRQALGTLSADVFTFYQGAMSRIEKQGEQDKSLARRALSYIFCTRRALDVEELLHALSIEAGDTQLDESALPEMEILLSVSGGLIRVDEKTGKTGLVHFTLQEYFKKYPEQLLPQFEMEMAGVCLTYLSFDAFESGPCTDDESLAQRLQKYRFLEYASRQWGIHVKASQLDNDQDRLQRLLGDDRKLSSSIQILHTSRYRMKGGYDRFPKQVTPLHVAADWGLHRILTVMCETVTDIDGQNSYGVTALQLAARGGHYQAAQLLLEKGAKIDLPNHKGETALAWASRNGHLETVKLLIQNGADALVEDNEKWTALHWAIMNGHNEVVKALLQHNANMGTGSVERNKGLILAADAGNEEITDMLLVAGANKDWRNNEGSTALTFAVPLGHEKTVHTLLRHGADVNVRDNYDNVALHWAITYPAITRLLLKNGAEVDAKNNEEKTPLHWAAQEGQTEVIEILIESRSNVNARDKFGFTPLHTAALKGYESMVQLLLENGANPSEKDEDGWTPLHAAALKQHDPISDLLLDNVENGKEILEQMTRRLEDEAQRDLLNEMADKKSVGSSVVSGLRLAVNSGYVERVLALLDAGADIDAEDSVGGSTALTIASWLCHLDIARVLLEHGADPNKPDRSGRTALHYAASHGYHALVEILVENGAHVDAKNHGWTAMLLAARKGFLWTADYLVQHGADVHSADYRGRRALHWAVYHGGVPLARRLVDRGADPNVTDCLGRTPLIWAVERNQHKATALLVRSGADATLAAQDFLPKRDSIGSWAGDDGDANATLGGSPSPKGMSNISKVDLQGSRSFLAKLGIGRNNGRGKVANALESGASRTDRVTEGLLLKVAERVDIIEPVTKFASAFQTGAGVRNVFNVRLDDWQPEDGVQYDLIWTQWCLGNLADEELVRYLQRCKAVVTPGKGVIVIKENLSTSEGNVFREIDSSVIRSDDKFRAIFQQAGLRTVKTEAQKGFPKHHDVKLFPVQMYALKPAS